VITDPWQHMLLSIVPEYEELKLVMERGHNFFINSKPQDDGTWLCGIDSHTQCIDYPGELNNVVNWTTAQLKNFPDCEQINWNLWLFKTTSALEKFKSLFILKWM